MQMNSNINKKMQKYDKKYYFNAHMISGKFQ